MRRASPLLPLAALLASACQDELLPTAPAPGAPNFSLVPSDYVVINTNDNGDGSLRRAIEMAQVATGEKTITFDIPAGDPGCTDGVCTITLASHMHIATKPEGLTIDGGATERTIISGNGAFVAFENQSLLTLKNLTITNGYALIGGGIYNGEDATLTLWHTDVLASFAELWGGGIANFGTLTLWHSTASHNSTYYHGGGIVNSGTMEMYHSTVANNWARGEFSEWAIGGGILNWLGGTATISHSIISDNRVSQLPYQGRGGGIHVDDGALTLSHSTVSGNITAELGGGFAIRSGTATISHSTFSGNMSAVWSGGLDVEHSASVTLSHSTVSGNTAQVTVGGISNRGSLTISHSTIVHNSGSHGRGGISADNSSNISIKNSIVASNPGGDCHGSISAQGVNLATDGSCGAEFTQVTAGELELGPHIDNGGPTLTLALGENSVAVDAAPDCTEWDGSPATTDQRGVSRPQGPACDVGAFELEQVPPDVTPPAISITTPADGAVFTLGQAVLADFACQDEAGGSGVGGCTGTVANGAVLPTDLVGTTTFTVQTEDSAGNVSSQTHTYSVVYDFRGFSPPVRNQGFNVAKAGQAIPLKWRLLDANGEAITTLGSATVTVQSLACSEGVTRGKLKGVLVRLWMHLAAAGNPGFQNLGNGYYQYNWKTPKDYAKSCKTLHLDLGDGITHTAKFSFAR